MRRSDRPTRRNRRAAAVPRWSAAPPRAVLSLTFLLLAGSVWSFAGVFEENWDSLGQGGDGINSFTMGPLFPVSDPVTADGSRCQYNDPDNPDANRTSPFRPPCVPWEGSDWHVHLPSNSPEAKSFSGDGSLHMGRHPMPGDPSWDDYITSQLSAAVSPPITLGIAPDPEEGPKLSFWHIIAVADARTFSAGGQTIDRAVVQVALSDADGNILSDWRTIQAFRNSYTRPQQTWFSNCGFDPVDDGSTEDDVTTPPGASPRGPSSTCAPQRAFHAMGDWTSTNRKDTGFADSKIGRPGNMGTGIWVESRFDLAAWESRTVRIRLLFSGLDIGPGIGYADLFGNSIGNGTRGWVLDDFRVTGTADP